MSTALLVAMDPLTTRSLAKSASLREIALEHVASPEEAEVALGRKAGAMDALVIGPLALEPVGLVQRAHQHDRDLSVLIFAPPDRVDEICGRLAVTPFVGSDTRCLPANGAIEQKLREAVETTRQRRSYRQTMAAASARLVTAPAPPRRPPVLDRLLEVAPVGVLYVTEEDRIVGANRAASQILGVDRERLTGAAISRLLGGTSPSAWMRSSGDGPGGGDAPHSFLERRVGSRTQHLEVRMASAVLQHNEPGYLVILQDVTERVEAERERAALVAQLRQAVDARDEFISIAAHELRTPLTPLKLLLQRTTAAELSAQPVEDVFRNLKRAERQVERLVTLVNGLLDVSRLQQGKLELRRTEVALGELVEGVVDSHAAELTRAGSSLELEVQAHVTGSWDEARIEQVANNLLSNAVRYGNGRPISVRVFTAKGRAVLEIQDRGMGVSQERRDTIFERFERGGLSRNYGGLGLGLFIAQQIVHAHGGAISVDSEPGHGSTFRVELPLG